MVAVFPAITGAASPALPESLGDEAEAACFYHAQNRASVPCDECGRFLCRLCDLEVDGRHLCPTCLNAGVTTKKVTAFENRRTMYDTIALALSTFPILLFWPVTVSAPMALYYSIRYWRRPLSLVPRTRVRFVFAVFFALGELGAIVAFFVALFWVRTTGRTS